MKFARRLLWTCMLLSLAGWAQSDRSVAPKSRKAHEAGAHTAHPTPRQLTLREKQERAQMRSEQRRQAQLAKKQRKQAMRRSRKTPKTTE